LRELKGSLIKPSAGWTTDGTVLEKTVDIGTLALYFRRVGVGYARRRSHNFLIAKGDFFRFFGGCDK